MSYPPQGKERKSLVRWARPNKITNSAGVRKNIVNSYYTFAETSAQGDIYYTELYGDGTETKLDVNFSKGGSLGKVDVYYNDVLLEAGIDAYGSGNESRTFTVNSISGKNILKTVQNGKNASATDYKVHHYAVSIS